MDTHTENETTINSKQLARRWGLSVHTLENWRSMGSGPRWLTLTSRGEDGGRFVHYLLADVEEFERERPKYAQVLA